MKTCISMHDGRCSSLDTTKINLYDRIRLTDGRTASVVEIFGEDTDFIVDIDLDGDWDTIAIRDKDIAERLEVAE